MLVVLAELGTPQMVGQFALGLAVTAPVIMFSNLELRAVHATDASHHYRFGGYLVLRLIATTLAFLVIVVIVLVTGYQRETALTILVVGLAKAFEFIGDLFYGVFLRHEHIDRTAKSLLLKGPISLVGLSLGVYLTDSVVGGACGLAFVWALLLFGYDVRNGVRLLRTSHRASPGHRIATLSDGKQAKRSGAMARPPTWTHLKATLYTRAHSQWVTA